MDDNRLTSWQWVFDSVSAGNIFFILVLGVIFLLVFFIPLKNLFCRVRKPRLSIDETFLTLRFSAIFLFLFSFITSVNFWKMPEVIVDASRYFTQAKHLEVYGIGYFLKEWGKNIMSWTDLPLIPFLYGLIFKFFGESRLYIQIFTTLLFSMTVVLTYLIGKELWDEDTGLYGGALLLGIPYLFVQAPLMLVDIPTMFFLTFSVFALIKSLRSNGLGMMVFSSFALFLAFFSKYSTWPMLSVLVVIFLVYLKTYPSHKGRGKLKALHLDGERRKRRWKKRTVLYIGILVLSMALLLIGVVIFFKYDIFFEQIGLLMSYQEPGLKRWRESLISTFFFQMHPFITISALYSTWRAFKKRDIRYLIIIWLVILLILFQVKRIRYTIPLFPMIALMASYGLQQIKDIEIRRFVVSCILLSSITVAAFAYLPFTQKMSAINLKDAGKFLDTIDEENVEVFTLFQHESLLNAAVAVPLLDLFTKKRIIYRYDSTFSHGREETEKSPLRFTWEYKNPGYYEGNNSAWEGTAVVVIASEPDEALPYHIKQRIRDCRLARAFRKSEGVFQYKTVVTVYRPSGKGILGFNKN